MIPEHEPWRIFRGPGYTVKAHPRSCFFCQHLTDIFYDSQGPYGFVCNRKMEEDIETGMMGECPGFEEETDDT